MILADNGFPIEIIFVLLFLVVSGVVNFVSWLAKKMPPGKSAQGRGAQEEGERMDRDNRERLDEDEGGARGERMEPTQSLRNFLEELTGQTEPPPAERRAPGQQRRPPSRPQRPARPDRRPGEEAPTVTREARRPAPRPAEHARRAPRPKPQPQRRAPQPTPAAKPQRTLQETAILEQAESYEGAERSQATGGLGSGTVSALAGGSHSIARSALEVHKGEVRQDWIATLPGNEIQRAIVLMEVLGQPRALKPHRRP